MMRRLPAKQIVLAITIAIIGASCTSAAPGGSPSPADTIVAPSAGQTEAASTATVDKSKIKIGLLVKTLSNSSWQNTADGAEAAATELGVKLDVRDVPTEADFKLQQDVAMTMVSQDYSAIIAASISNTNLIPAIVAANKKSVPWIAIAEENDPKVMSDLQAHLTAFIKFSFYKEGLKIGKFVGDALNGSGKVGVVEGQTGNSATQDRNQGIKDAFQAYPGVTIVSSQPADWDRQKAINVATNMIQANPDINAIIANNDTMALGVVIAVQQAGKTGKIIVTGDDGTKEAFQKIKEGSMDATVALGGWMIGYLSVYAATKASVEPGTLPDWELEPLLIDRTSVDENLAAYPKPTKEFFTINAANPYQNIPGF